MNEQKKMICSCGCGKEFDYLDKKGRARRFIHGHNMNGRENYYFKKGFTPWNKGKKGYSGRWNPWNRGLSGIKTCPRGRTPHNKKELNEKEIIKHYKEDLLSVIEIGKIYGCSFAPIFRILKEKNIITTMADRKKELYQKGKHQVWNKGLNGEVDSRIHSGENHYQWLGGKSFEPYPQEFNRPFKKSIRTRDGFLCLKCGLREEDSLILFKRLLHVHHIDYIKENTFKENCCALCIRCNIEVNVNRKHWTKFFQSMLSERYGYKYDEKGQIILKIGT